VRLTDMASPTASTVAAGTSPRADSEHGGLAATGGARGAWPPAGGTRPRWGVLCVGNSKLVRSQSSRGSGGANELRTQTLKPGGVTNIVFRMLFARSVAWFRIAIEVCCPSNANHANQQTCHRQAPL
jgi:hypothetical protein